MTKNLNGYTENPQILSKIDSAITKGQRFTNVEDFINQQENSKLTTRNFIRTYSKFKKSYHYNSSISEEDFIYIYFCIQFMIFTNATQNKFLWETDIIEEFLDSNLYCNDLIPKDKFNMNFFLEKLAPKISTEKSARTRRKNKK